MNKWLSVELSLLLLVSLVAFAGFMSLQSSDNFITGEIFGRLLSNRAPPPPPPPSCGSLGGTACLNKKSACPAGTGGLRKTYDCGYMCCVPIKKPIPAPVVKPAPVLVMKPNPPASPSKRTPRPPDTVGTFSAGCYFKDGSCQVESIRDKPISVPCSFLSSTGGQGCPYGACYVGEDFKKNCPKCGCASLTKRCEERTQRDCNVKYSICSKWVAGEGCPLKYP